jgi:hypothetical protein
LTWLLAPVLALGLGWAALSASDAAAATVERPVSGLVTRVYALSQTVHVGSSQFHVPADVYDLDDLSVGTYVVITFERANGRSVATSIEAGTDPH